MTQKIGDVFLTNFKNSSLDFFDENGEWLTVSNNKYLILIGLKNEKKYNKYFLLYSISNQRYLIIWENLTLEQNAIKMDI